MKIIWTFTLLMIPGVLSSISVKGYSGGGVTITCKYDKEYKTNAKYFCRGEWSECTDQIRTEIKHQWIRSGRFSLFDNTTAAVFTVTIRNLRKEDSGIYHCGIKRFAFDHDTEVNLKVLKEFRNQVNTNVGTVRRHSGGNITIDYTYEKQHKSREKSVCKIGEYLCETLISISRPAEKKDSGRFSIHDNRSAGLLRVFIRELNVQDSGEYRIIVRHSKDYSFFSEFELDITDDAPKTTSSSPSSSLSSSSSPSSSSYISTLQTPLSTTVSERSIVTSQFNTITESSLIIPLVLVLLLLIIAALLLLFLHKKHQTKGGDSQTGPGNTAVVSHTACDYEEIKDTHKQLPTNPSESSSAVYATAQLPTNPSESFSSVYATAELPTNPSGAYSTVYATAQLPNNPSDSCLYSTVQEASGDSQICISSAEGLNYAMMNFHKTPDLRNSQECSEYAAVNHTFTA